MMGRFSFFKTRGEPSRLSRVPTKEQILNEGQPRFDERLVMEAELLVENQALRHVFERLKLEAITTMTASTPGIQGVNEREQAHHRIRALDDIEAGIQAIIDDRKFYKKPVEDQP